MELNELISKTLDELEKSKRNSNKKNYLIDDIVLDISVSSITSKGGGLDLQILNYEQNKIGENIHRVIVKLKPVK